MEADKGNELKDNAMYIIFRHINICKATKWLSGKVNGVEGMLGGCKSFRTTWEGSEFKKKKKMFQKSKVGEFPSWHSIKESDWER